MDIKALREEFGNAQHEAHAVISAAAVAKRDLTPEEKTANDRRFSRMEQIKAQFDEQARFAKLALDAGDVTLPAEPAGRKEFDASEKRQAFTDASGNMNVSAVVKAINHYGRTGDSRQLFTITSGTNSGAYLPKEVLSPVTVRRLQNCWRAALSAQGMKPMEIDTTASFSIPVADDTGNVGQNTSESATTGTALDPAQSGIAINPTLWDSKALWYSNTLVNTNAFDVVSFSLPALQKRIDKFQETQWTATAIANANVGYTLPSATAVVYEDVINWEHSLTPSYRSDACFLVSDSLYKALRGITDTVGRPIFDTDPTNSFQGKIHNRPVIVGDYWQTLAANHVCGAFVSADAIKIVDVMDARLARYSNLPTFPDQVGFQMFQNGDFGFVTNGMSLLKSAIS